ncbi:MAG TPA: glycoside hydrolase family 15 protein, partial [Thermoplasmata archaeon]
YRIEKEVIGAPHLACLLQRSRLTIADGRGPFHLYALAAPHLDVGGWGNNAYVVELPGRTVLAAEKNGTWLALGASVPFLGTSVGYVGASDGWTDLNVHGRLAWEFDRATDGNVALVGELAYQPREEFTIALAFGRGLPHAVATLLQALGTPYRDHREKFLDQWGRVSGGLAPLAPSTGDGGNLLRSSYSVLLAHEDKTFPGAFIASLSIPWGFARGDADRGGYHLVWTRDLVEVALGLLAAGNLEAPRRTLVYLASIQQPDGGFPQNGWLDGTPYRTGVQLDEVAFPILLAHHLKMAGALGEFDPVPMVRAAARFLVDRSPCTQQERWEEASGYSPSTLAVVIAALVVAASFLRAAPDEEGGRFLEEYADFLESNVERWTYATTGADGPEPNGHYVRIHPVDPSDPTPDEDPNLGLLPLVNQPPGAPAECPAVEVVDPGFLELVRYGIRRPDDPRVLSSLAGVDRLLKVATPFGPVWHRYNHDGYGEPREGGPYMGFGVGRAWPLLTGERGHFELAAGRDGRPYLASLERLAGATALLPEQVWDEDDRPELHLELGRPTGAARPLA